jgi:hypothetical protein
MRLLVKAEDDHGEELLRGLEAGVGHQATDYASNGC